GAAGGIAAAFANPVGIIIAIILAIIAVLVILLAVLLVLPAALKNWGAAMLENNRQFAEASGRMAQIFAQVDLQRFFMSRDTGNALAPSTRYLASGQMRLERSLQPMTQFFGTIKNLFVGGVINVLASINEFLNEKLFKFLNKILELLGVLGGEQD